MIKLSEYRVGNLVRWNPSLQTPTSTLMPLHVEIVAMMGKKVGYISPNIESRVEPFEDDQLQKEIAFRMVEELEPIVLTHEIIEQAGFSEDKLHAVQGHTHHYLYWSGETVVLQHLDGQALSNPVTYLHQLQNLYFALTGNELDLSRHKLTE